MYSMAFLDMIVQMDLYRDRLLLSQTILSFSFLGTQ